MKRVLIITHVESEGPGTLEHFLRSLEGIVIHRTRLYNGETFPNEVREVDAIITMGGPMNVYDEDEYPFLKEETDFLANAIEANIPILGICLGAQMIAKACHASVNTAFEKECGWRDVSLTDIGRRDILFQGVADPIRAFQWHEDTFEIPHGGVLLATSSECTNQAFRYGNAYGFQFHVEVTDGILTDWFDTVPECREWIGHYEKIKDDFYTQASIIYSNFLWLTDISRQVTRRRRR